MTATSVRPDRAGDGDGAALDLRRTWVDDRPAYYAVAGEGLPVLLLHGWGLGQHAYKSVVRRLVEAGCRVVAPALPGFGGTPDLKGSAFSLVGYGRWVERFRHAVHLEEPSVVVGHSFGGGVAIRFAYDHPDAVSRLVLVNSIGGSAWKQGETLRSIGERPLWDWGLHLPNDIWPLPQATKVLPVILEDAVPNLLRNPRAFLRVGRLARGADLRHELEELKRRGLPVTVLWGTRDGLIPRESFDAICTAVGTTGTVVEGSHSWLLADPDRFVEVITNDLDVARAARAVRGGGAGREFASFSPEPAPGPGPDPAPGPDPGSAGLRQARPQPG